MKTWTDQYQNVSILEFIRATDNAGSSDNWSYKMCKAPVKSSPPTNAQLVTGQMPFLSLNQQRQSTERKNI